MKSLIFYVVSGQKPKNSVSVLNLKKKIRKGTLH